MLQRTLPEIRGNDLCSSFCMLNICPVSNVVWRCRSSAATVLKPPCLSPCHGATHSTLVHTESSAKGPAQVLPWNAATPLHNQTSQGCNRSQATGWHASPTYQETSSSEDSPSSTALLLASGSSQAADSPQQSCVTVCEGDSANSSGSTPLYGTVSASLVAKASPVLVKSPFVKAVGLKPLQKAPKGNSVKQYHKLSSMHGVTFYQSLEVTDEYGNQHCFDVQDSTQGALVSTLVSSALCASQE